MTKLTSVLLVLCCLFMLTHQSLLSELMSVPKMRDQPKVRADSFTMFWVNLWYFFTQPGSQSTVSMFSSAFIDYVVPMLGGYLRVQAHKTYINDQYTFDNAGVTELQIYQ